MTIHDINPYKGIGRERSLLNESCSARSAREYSYVYAHSQRTSGDSASGSVIQRG